MKKIEFLDGVRGLAIILVIIFHLIIMVIPEELYTPFWLNAGRFLMHGVTLFFVLSGFLIGSLLLTYRNSKHYFKAFYIRRIARILPFYYLILGSYYIIKYLIIPNYSGSEINSAIPDWTYPFFIQSAFIPSAGLGSGVLNVTWSLCVEEQFYLFAPLFIYLFNNSKVILIGIAGIFATLFSRMLIPGIDELGILALITSRADALLMGIVIAVIYRNTGLMMVLKKNLILLYLFLGVLAFGILLRFAGFSLGVFSFTWIAMFFAVLVLIPLANDNAIVSKFFKLNMLKVFGKYSYGIYLYHMPVYYLVHALNNKYGIDLSSLTQVLLFNVFSVGLIFVVSFISYEFYEKRFINMAKHVSYN
jgi:peptidoglycan/LPS O-acetylase OafA/YrhL